MKRSRKPPRRTARQGDTRVMFLIRLHATPSQDSPDHGSIGGAYINCWIVANSLEEATERARHDVQGYGWQPDSVEHAVQITRLECVSDRAREMYDQAMIDQEVYDYHQYPPEDGQTPDV